MWVCPTLGRPNRLAELARSWERFQPNTKLAVRLWEGDPLLGEYSGRSWPKNWLFYRSEQKYLGPSLNEFFKKNPDEETYGFIADDIVLRTPGGIEHLEALAHPWFIAYPNDCVQRSRLCTHFCVGGDLVRELGWFSLPTMRHTVDLPWYNVGRNLALLRYAPQVIFQHKHFITGQAVKDETYAIIYKGESTAPNSRVFEEDKVQLERWLHAKEGKGLAKCVIDAMRMVAAGSEDWEEWAAQDRADAIIVPEGVH